MSTAAIKWAPATPDMEDTMSENAAVVDAKALAAAVRLAAKAADGKSNLPVLGHIHAATDGTKLVLTATDLTTAVTVRVPGAGVLPPTCIPVKALTGALKGAKGEVTLRREADTSLSVVNGASARLVGLDGRDFPRVLDLPERAPDATLESKALADALAFVAMAASGDDTRPHLYCVNLDGSDDGRLRLVATDGYRLHVRECACEGHLPAETLIVPKTAAVLVKAIKAAKGGRVGVWIEKDTFFARVGPTVVVSGKVTDARFPPWRQVVPTLADCDKGFTVGAEALARVCAGAAMFFRKAKHRPPYIAAWSIVGNTLTVKAEDVDAGGEWTGTVDVADVVGGLDGRLFALAVDQVCDALAGVVGPVRARSAGIMYPFRVDDAAGLRAVTMPGKVA